MVTFGIEEELFLVDKSTLKPASVAECVLSDLSPAMSISDRVTSEFLVRFIFVTVVGLAAGT